jgi:hypothetical protein
MAIKSQQVSSRLAIGIIATLLVSFTVYAQLPQKEGRKSSFSSLRITESLTVSAEDQPEAPLILLFEEVKFRDTLRPQINFRLDNKTEKRIIGYSLRRDEETAAGKSSRLMFYPDPFTWRQVLPGKSDRIMFRHSIKEDQKRLILSVEAVEFDDGTSWHRQADKPSAESSAAQHKDAT